MAVLPQAIFAIGVALSGGQNDDYGGSGSSPYHVGVVLVPPARLHHRESTTCRVPLGGRDQQALETVCVRASRASRGAAVAAYHEYDRRRVQRPDWELPGERGMHDLHPDIQRP